MVAALTAFAVVAIAAVLYLTVIRGRLAVAASAMDKVSLVADATTLWGKIDAKLLGWKTIILAWVAVSMQALPPLLNEALPQVANLPWVQVVDQKFATWITIVCTLLIPVVHAQGMAKAAVSVPPDPSA